MKRKLLQFVLLVVGYVVTVWGFSVDRRELLLGVIAGSLSLPFINLIDSSLEAPTRVTDVSTKKARPLATKAAGVGGPRDRPLGLSGVYWDPKHPSGYRVVRPAGQGRFSLTIQDDPTSKTLTLNGLSKYNRKTGETSLTMDFSPVGGPSLLLAKYSPSSLLLANTCGTGGLEILPKGIISLPDDSIWIKDSGVQGVYSDPLHPDGYRMIRDLGSAKLLVEIADHANQIPVVIKGIANKREGTVWFDFRAKGGPRKLSAVVRGNELIFRDGTKWTKQ